LDGPLHLRFPADACDRHYRLDGEDPFIVASGHTVFDLGVARQLRRGIELNVSLDNFTNRNYYVTQNYFDSRIAPGAPVVRRIHATPSYPLTVVAGLTFRLPGK
jgi:outer membrane receptor protein involved in Fe transport